MDFNIKYAAKCNRLETGTEFGLKTLLLSYDQDNPLTAQAINSLVSKSRARDAERAAEYAKKEQPGFFAGIMQSFGLWKKADEAKMVVTKDALLDDKNDPLEVVKGIEQAANNKKAA